MPLAPGLEPFFSKVCISPSTIYVDVYTWSSFESVTTVLAPLGHFWESPLAPHPLLVLIIRRIQQANHFSTIGLNHKLLDFPISLWSKQTAAIRSEAVCTTSPLLTYKTYEVLLRLGCSQVADKLRSSLGRLLGVGGGGQASCVQAAVRLRWRHIVNT